MKPSLMWALVWPHSNVNTTRGLCPRWDAQAVMATRWNMSIKRHSPPRGRYVQRVVLAVARVDAGRIRGLGPTQVCRVGEVADCQDVLAARVRRVVVGEDLELVM